MLRSAKIVATIGPSTDNEAVLSRLIDAGMDVARLNFSHGTHDDHARRIAILRELSIKFNKPITILQDLQGPKIRVGSLPQPIDLVDGKSVVLSTEMPSDGAFPSPQANLTVIPIDFPELPKSVTIGSRILLDDGNIELEVTGIEDQNVVASVVQGGQLSSHKGMNLPGSVLPIPGFTDKDREDLAFGLSQGVDAVAISFVRTPQDVDNVRQAIREIAPEQSDTAIIAKLERPEALDNLEEIIQRSDGVMVARGDLGVEMPPATVPIAQKRIIASATAHSNLVITATQMLESMINNPRPTRAEASDVANAIFDGTDAVMLSAETASGNYPVESVAMMSAIIHHAEDHAEEWGHCQPPLYDENHDDAISMTRAARELAHDRNVAAIAVFTVTGHTALLMSKARPQVPIFCFTPIERTYQQMGMYWGSLPFLVPFASTMEAMIEHVEQALVSHTSIEAGQQVVLISGFPVGAFRRPNFALLHTIGERLS